MNLLVLCLSGIVLLKTVSAQLGVGGVTAWAAGGAPGGDGVPVKALTVAGQSIGPGAGVTYNAIKNDPNILKLVKMGILAPFTNSFIVIDDPKRTKTKGFRLNAQNLKTTIASLNEVPTSSSSAYLPNLSESSYTWPKLSKVNDETLTMPPTVTVVKIKQSTATAKTIPTPLSKMQFITPETTHAPVTTTPVTTTPVTSTPVTSTAATTTTASTTSATTTPATTTPSSTAVLLTIPSTTDQTTTTTKPNTVETLTTQKLRAQKFIRPFISNIFSGKIGIPKQKSEPSHRQTYQTSDLNTENISNTKSQNIVGTKVTQYDSNQNAQEHAKLSELKSVTYIKPLLDTSVSNRLGSQVHVSYKTMLNKEKPKGIKLTQSAINNPLSNFGYKPTKPVNKNKVESTIGMTRDTLLTEAIPNSIKLAKHAINGAVSDFEYERTSFKKTMLALLKTLVMIQDFIRTNAKTTTAVVHTTTTTTPTTPSPTTTILTTTTPTTTIPTTTTQPTTISTTATTTTTTQPTTITTQATYAEAADLLVVPSQEAYHLLPTVTTQEKATPVHDKWPEATPITDKWPEATHITDKLPEAPLSWDSAMDFVRKYVAAIANDLQKSKATKIIQYPTRNTQPPPPPIPTKFKSLVLSSKSLVAPTGSSSVFSPIPPLDQTRSTLTLSNSRKFIHPKKTSTSAAKITFSNVADPTKASIPVSIPTKLSVLTPVRQSTATSTVWTTRGANSPRIIKPQPTQTAILTSVQKLSRPAPPLDFTDVQIGYAIAQVNAATTELAAAQAAAKVYNPVLDMGDNIKNALENRIRQLRTPPGWIHPIPPPLPHNFDPMHHIMAAFYGTALPSAGILGPMFRPAAPAFPMVNHQPLSLRSPPRRRGPPTATRRGNRRRAFSRSRPMEQAMPNLRGGNAGRFRANAASRWPTGANAASRWPTTAGPQATAAWNSATTAGFVTNTQAGAAWASQPSTTASWK